MSYEELAEAMGVILNQQNAIRYFYMGDSGLEQGVAEYNQQPEPIIQDLTLSYIRRKLGRPVGRAEVTRNGELLCTIHEKPFSYVLPPKMILVYSANSDGYQELEEKLGSLFGDMSYPAKVVSNANHVWLTLLDGRVVTVSDPNDKLRPFVGRYVRVSGYWYMYKDSYGHVDIRTVLGGGEWDVKG